MLNRRDFLRRAAMVAAGVIVVDQLELLDRLAPRRLFAAWPTMPTLYGDGIHDDTAALQAMVDASAVWNARHKKMLGGHDGRHLWLPDGTYAITAPITITPTERLRVEIRDMHVIQNTPGADILQVRSPAGIHFHNLSWERS